MNDNYSNKVVSLPTTGRDAYEIKVDCDGRPVRILDFDNCSPREMANFFGRGEPEKIDNSGSVLVAFTPRGRERHPPQP